RCRARAFCAGESARRNGGYGRGQPRRPAARAARRAACRGRDAAVAGRAVAPAQAPPCPRAHARGDRRRQSGRKRPSERFYAHLERAGFAHYEISSWARPGRRAVHNSLYWTGGEYLGLGCSAASFRRLPDGGGERFSGVRSVDKWLRAAEPAQKETLDRAALE